jgi:hypothetical protein
MATMTTPSMPPPLPPAMQQARSLQAQSEPEWKRVRPLPEAHNTRADVVAYRSAVVHSKTPTRLEYLPDALLVVDHSQSGLILDLIDVEGKGMEAVDELAAGACAHEIIEFKGRIIMPGFIDTHAHAPQYAFTGTGMNLPLLKWCVPCSSWYHCTMYRPSSWVLARLALALALALTLTRPITTITQSLTNSIPPPHPISINTPSFNHPTTHPTKPPKPPNPGWRRTPFPARPSSPSWTSHGRSTPSPCAATS